MHDCLSEFGGAERVVLSIVDMFPDAHLFVAYADKTILERYFSHIHKSHVHVLLSHVKFWARHKSLFQILAPFIWRSLSFDGFDTVIISAGHLMPNLIHAPHVRQIQYIHSPPKNIFLLESPTPLQSVVHFEQFIKNRYISVLRSTSYLVTNSKHTKSILKQIANVNAECIYPPVYISRALQKKKSGKYYLIVSRLDRSKSIELAIEASNMLKEQLYIVGVSNEKAYERYLYQIAGPTIHFLGFQSDKRISQLYQHAKAFLFTPTNEDFGIAPVEAMAHGVPVIAYYGGGVRETVIEGKTGMFFHTHSVGSLISVMKKFYPENFSPRTLYREANRFSQQSFQNQFSAYIEKVVSTQRALR